MCTVAQLVIRRYPSKTVGVPKISHFSSLAKVRNWRLKSREICEICEICEISEVCEIFEICEISEICFFARWDAKVPTHNVKHTPGPSDWSKCCFTWVLSCNCNGFIGDIGISANARASARWSHIRPFTRLKKVNSTGELLLWKCHWMKQHDLSTAQNRVW